MNAKVTGILLLLLILPAGLWFTIPPAEGEADGRSTTQWIEATKSRNPVERATAARALGQIGRAEFDNVKGARWGLMSLHDRVTGGKCVAPMAPALIGLLRDGDALVRLAAVEALVKMDEYADADMLNTVAGPADPMTMWGVCAVYNQAQLKGRNIHKVLSVTDGGNKLLSYIDREPIPEYADLVGRKK